jgi:hypothetical protein
MMNLSDSSSSSLDDEKPEEKQDLNSSEELEIEKLSKSFKPYQASIKES